MKKIGIICEYNPFHNGHIHHLEEIKKRYPDSCIILVLGSYFLQRGEVSLISKWNKTKIALYYGVNLVIELPTLYNTNSGDYFAYYAVLALSIAKVDCIIFGSESADISMLKDIASKQESLNFNEQVKSHLQAGSNYPTSLSKSLNIALKSNDLLGVSYIKAIQKIDFSIEPIAIKRTNDFNDITSNDPIISASNIREKLKNDISIVDFIPDYDFKLINEIDEEKLFELLKYRIMTDSHLENYLGVDEGLENKLKKVILKTSSLDELLSKIKSKRYTSTRLKRMLVHILLGIEKNDMNSKKEQFRILGFDSVGREYLKKLNSKNLVFKLEDRSEIIEKRAAYIYFIITKDKSTKFEYLNKPIIKE